MPAPPIPEAPLAGTTLPPAGSPASGRIRVIAEIPTTPDPPPAAGSDPAAADPNAGVPLTPPIDDPTQGERVPSRPVTVADRRAPLAAARRQSGSRIPGATAVWVFAAIAVFGLAVGLAFAFNGGGDGDDTAQAVAATPSSQSGASTADAAASETAVPGAPAAASPGVDPSTEVPPVPAPAPAPDVSPLLGFTIPIGGACVPESELLLPGSPRAYRNGTHEGVDFYSGAVGGCPAELVVSRATPVLAAKAGVIVRADWAYLELSQIELDAAAAAGFQGEQILDRFRGRQIWIDHGAGIVSRYAHLGAIAAGLDVGLTVTVGQVIGFAGESGTPESVQAPGTDIHGHFEIRVGDGYLGEGLPIQDARLLYLEALGVISDNGG